MTYSRILVVTTINGINHQGIRNLVGAATSQEYKLILVGDSKTPEYPLDLHRNVSFISIEAQHKLDFRSARVFPSKHYARKNLGYLLAFREENEWIGESDDDNLCSESFWASPSYPLTEVKPKFGRYLNTFSVMDVGTLWPRGLPVTSLKESFIYEVVGKTKKGVTACIQGLTDDEPDVDAIARSLYDTKVKFPDKAFVLSSGFYAPINSQMTRWNVSLCLPLLYLPFTVPWRVADIWRGFIAQRFFTLKSWNTVYRGSVGSQARNPHDLKVDFFEEVQVHTKTDNLIDTLNGIDATNISEFLMSAYSQLVDNRLMEPQELDFLTAWLDDCSSVSDVF